MYSLQDVFLIAFLSCLFIANSYSDGNDVNQVNIREKGTINQTTQSTSTINASVAVNNPQKSLSTSLNSTPNVSSNQQVISEGGAVPPIDETHQNGREHEFEPSPVKPVTSKPVTSTNVTLTKSEVVNPIHNKSSVLDDIEVPPQHDQAKQSVPKKGVSFPETELQLNVTAVLTNTTSNTSPNPVLDRKVTNIKGANETKENSSKSNAGKHKKPLVTESDSDHIDITKSKEDGSKENILTVDQIDPLIPDKNSDRSDYIVPIVAVILSVPLVAILISVVYKRGTDWWQHRNYKRMDFLIEGMYHN